MGSDTDEGGGTGRTWRSMLTEELHKSPVSMSLRPVQMDLKQTTQMVFEQHLER
jgi:hypothetical protein